LLDWLPGCPELLLRLLLFGAALLLVVVVSLLLVEVWGLVGSLAASVSICLRGR
jgi:hypothetical protein